jgi:hypothetical protein
VTSKCTHWLKVYSGPRGGLGMVKAADRMQPAEPSQQLLSQPEPATQAATLHMTQGTC